MLASAAFKRAKSPCSLRGCFSSCSTTSFNVSIKLSVDKQNETDDLANIAAANITACPNGHNNNQQKNCDHF
jgi:hypothetical protein